MGGAVMECRRLAEEGGVRERRGEESCTEGGSDGGGAGEVWGQCNECQPMCSLASVAVLQILEPLEFGDNYDNAIVGGCGGNDWFR